MITDDLNAIVSGWAKTLAEGRIPVFSNSDEELIQMMFPVYSYLGEHRKTYLPQLLAGVMVWGNGRVGLTEIDRNQYRFTSTPMASVSYLLLSGSGFSDKYFFWGSAYPPLSELKLLK